MVEVWDRPLEYIGALICGLGVVIDRLNVVFFFIVAEGLPTELLLSEV